MIFKTLYTILFSLALCHSAKAIYDQNAASNGSAATYNYYRDYEPATGRYIQSDPIGLDGGLNLYGYANQNPLSFTDPYGLITWTGTVLSTGAGPFSYEIYTLRSPCCADGYRWKVKVQAKGVGPGRRIAYTGSSIELDDHLPQCDHYIFNGDYSKVSAGVSWGIGIGFNTVILGGAQSPGSWGLEAGIDLFSAGASIGKSKVTEAQKEPCDCREK